MAILGIVLFAAILGTASFLAYKRFSFIVRNIKLGKDEAIEGNTSLRLKNLLLLAFGQKKMFHNPLVAFLHLIIYLAFFIINVELLEIIIDGFSGSHRALAPYLGGFYKLLINTAEVLAVLVIIACVVFLYRRNSGSVARFQSPELKAWPRLDANIILVAEIVLMILFLKMNAADTALQNMGNLHYYTLGSLVVSGHLVSFFSQIPEGVLVVLERSFWFLHLSGLLAFLVYVTYSKHLHIILAFPNAWFLKQNAVGEVKNMPVVTNEVKLALGLEGADSSAPPADGKFGAKDVTDLSWKNLLGAYACTECGRCTAACPANQTGKTLSPRKIMMDTRDRLEEVGANLDKGIAIGTDGKALLDNYITREELLACTTCNACVEACPVSINPLDIIVEMRRYMVMEESAAPASWNSMFNNVENNFAPWAFSPSDRLNWKSLAEKE